MKKILDDSKYEIPQLLFLVINMMGIGLFLIFCIWKGSVVLEWLNMQNNTDYVMMDYAKPIVWAQDLATAYDKHALYPPLVVLFSHAVCRMTSLGPDINPGSLMNEPWNWMIYVMFCALGVVSIIIPIMELKIKEIYKWLLALSIIFSVPFFAGALERGNFVLYAVGFTFGGVLLRNSKSAWKRECALIFIALAAGIKLYPCIIGLSYLKEKRWSETIRLIIYGVLAIFVPFLWCGGVSSMQKFLTAIISRADYQGSGRVQFVKGMLSIICSNQGVVNILYILFVILVVLGILLSKSKMREASFLAIFMSVIPSNSYRFTLLFFVIPLAVIMTSKFYDKKSLVIGSIQSFLLSGMFAIPVLIGIANNFAVGPWSPSMSIVELTIYTFTWLFVLEQGLEELLSYIKIHKSDRSLI